MALADICVNWDLDLGNITLGQGHDTSLGHRHQLCEILSRSNLAVSSYGPDMDLAICALWPWRYDLGSNHGQQ